MLLTRTEPCLGHDQHEIFEADAGFAVILVGCARIGIDLVLDDFPMLFRKRRVPGFLDIPDVL